MSAGQRSMRIEMLKSRAGISSPVISVVRVFRARTAPASRFEAAACLPIPEIRVCTNKACKRAGSHETLNLLRELSDDSLNVVRSGCLGKCGNGPNVVILPDEVFISHLSTPAQVVRLLERLLQKTDVQEKLEAMMLRQEGNSFFEQGKYEQAIGCYTNALERVSSAKHKLHANRAAAKLATRDFRGALEDALSSIEIGKSSPGFAAGYVRFYEAAIALDMKEEAQKKILESVDDDELLLDDSAFRKLFQEAKGSLKIHGE